MTKREVILEYDEDEEEPDPTKYADLAHAVWMTAKVAMPSGGFTVHQGKLASHTALNQRWTNLGNQIPWRP
ncbi:MAG: hypothetical protein L0H24_00150 [Microlunatus sp.]|nr:hypothetical protein [Microlunatus sp.]